MVKKLTEAARPDGQDAYGSSSPDGQKNSQKQLALMPKKPLAARPEGQEALSGTPCFTLIEQALSAFFNVNYV
jgi:hypothetical protein